MTSKSTVTLWFPKHLRDHANAEGFADYLDRHCAWSADRFDGAEGWEAAIPTPDRWEEEVAAFNAHLETL